MTAGATQTRRVPGVKNLDLIGRKHHQMHFGFTGRRLTGFVAFHEECTAADPLAVLRPAAPLPATGDAMSAGDRRGFSGRRGGTACDDIRVCSVNFPRPTFREERG